MKLCPNNHENKDEAKYCAICGSPISQTCGSLNFTLTKFDEIKLIPVQHKFFAPASFWALWIVSIMLVFFATAAITEGFYERSDYFQEGLAAGISLTLLLIIILFIPYWRYRNNTDFIEDIKSDIKRIAKDCKLGLYNGKKKQILLKSRYDGIEKIDEVHYLIQRKGKYGIYSVSRKKLIVPVKFERVSQQYDGVWTAEKNGNVSHYNYSGKIVK